MLLVENFSSTTFGGEGVFCGIYKDFLRKLGVEIILFFCYYIYYKLITE